VTRVPISAIASTFKPVAERLLWLDCCDEDVLGDGVNWRSLRRCWSSYSRRPDAVVPALYFVVNGRSSDASQHKVVEKVKSRVVLSCQEIDIIAATLAVLEVAGPRRHGPVNLRGLELRTPDGRRDLDVVEETVKDGW